MEKLISKLIENEIIYVVKASKIKQILDFFPTQIFYQGIPPNHSSNANASALPTS